MASKKPRGVSVAVTSSRQPRKYLGDPSDPHFIPKSPLIERQRLSEKDEAELKRLCTLALSGVPHSDEMTDDPFRYLGKHITAKPPKPQRQASTQDHSRTKYEPIMNPSTFSGRVSSSEDTATPSEVSKRETIRTNDTTPLTTPDITPCDTRKAISDAGRRPSTAAPSQLRTEFKSVKGSSVYSFLKDGHHTRQPHPAIATKSLTCLPINSSTSKTRSKQGSSAVPSNAKKLGKIGVAGRPDFNKSLPALPRIPTFEEAQSTLDLRTDKEKNGAFPRKLKSVGVQRPRNQPLNEGRFMSVEQARHFDTLEGIPETPVTKKQRRFNIWHIFHKNSGDRQRATVG